jgi:hypothetical protein
VNGRRTVNASTIVVNGLGAEDISKIFKEENRIQLKLRRAKEAEYGDYSPF